MPRIDNDTCTYRKISFLAPGNCVSYTVLDSNSEVLEIKQIYPAIHKTVTIGGGYDCVLRQRKDIATNNIYFWIDSKLLFPKIHKRGFYIYEYKFHHFLFIFVLAAKWIVSHHLLDLIVGRVVGGKIVNRSLISSFFLIIILLTHHIILVHQDYKKWCVRQNAYDAWTVLIARFKILYSHSLSLGLMLRFSCVRKEHRLEAVIVCLSFLRGSFEYVG